MNKVRGQQVFTVGERLKRNSTVDPITGCWNWNGATRNGYGRIVLGSRSDGTRHTSTAHRASHEHFIGEIPPGMDVCHRCDNPPCINPAHLFAGTRQQNVDDREQKGRGVYVQGEQNGQAKLTEAYVVSARRLRAKGLIYQVIADRFGVDKRTIMRAIKGERWTHVQTGEPHDQE